MVFLYLSYLIKGFEQMPESENGSKIPTEKEEKNFREFMNRLLQAQSYDFLNDTDLFSRKTLHKTLKKFCEIIADELGAQSCTIHLKIYDPEEFSTNGHFDGKLKSYLKKINLTNKDECKQRKSICKTTMNFPYWQYEKGAVQLIAANGSSPWHSIFFVA